MAVKSVDLTSVKDYLDKQMSQLAWSLIPHELKDEYWTVLSETIIDNNRISSEYLSHGFQNFKASSEYARLLQRMQTVVLPPRSGLHFVEVLIARNTLMCAMFSEAENLTKIVQLALKTIQNFRKDLHTTKDIEQAIISIITDSHNTSLEILSLAGFLGPLLLSLSHSQPETVKRILTDRRIAAIWRLFRCDEPVEKTVTCIQFDRTSAESASWVEQLKAIMACLRLKFGNDATDVSSINEEILVNGKLIKRFLEVYSAEQLMTGDHEKAESLISSTEEFRQLRRNVDNAVRLSLLKWDAKCLIRAGRHRESIPIWSQLLTDEALNPSTLVCIAGTFAMLENGLDELEVLRALVKSFHCEHSPKEASATSTSLLATICCLLVPDEEITLPNALYIYARRCLDHKVYSDSAETFLDLLAVMTQSHLSPTAITLGIHFSLPSQRVMFREMALAFHLNGLYSFALDVCKTSDDADDTDDWGEGEKEFLVHDGTDGVLMLIKASATAAIGKVNEAIGIINRAISTAKAMELMYPTESTKMIIARTFCGKCYKRRAMMFEQTGQSSECNFSLETALQYIPDDFEVREKLKQRTSLAGQEESMDVQSEKSLSTPDFENDYSLMHISFHM